MRYIITAFLIILFSFHNNAQTWTDMGKERIIERGRIDISPETYRLMKVDDSAIKDILWKAPYAINESIKDIGVVIEIPMRNGEIEQFHVVRYTTKEPGLAAKFPDIRSFIGISTNDPLLSVRADYTVHGLRAVIDDHGVKTYIDHYQHNDRMHKVIYQKHEYQNNDPFTCGAYPVKGGVEKSESNDSRAGDCIFKEYQLTVSATSGYTGFHGANSDAGANLVMSAIETSMNRINGIYEREVAARFIIVADTDLLWFYNYNNDPFGGNAANPPVVNGNMLNINVAQTNNIIGSANYDIGHVFALGDGGIAQTPAVCINGKAAGATGRDNPVGDPFDVDYVAHELGHQFGGNHVQNNSCQRNNATAVEPGSGSSIMGYAGICAPNVDNMSHDNFNAVSIAEMKNWIDNRNCHSVIAINNTAPIVNAVADKTLPISTPFVLTGDANDPDGDPMLYTWDQIDNEIAQMPPSANSNQGPSFRALPVTDNSSRYFPMLSTVSSGAASNWEVLPAVSRTMDFRFTARDAIVNVGGCTIETDVTLTFTDNSGPFLVLLPNGGETYLQQQMVTVTWDVAGTNVAPVACADVDILLSTDDGLTYPNILLASTTNDGSASVTMPAVNSATCRIMIRCADNYFFDISNGNFEISDGIGPICTTITSNDIPVDISPNGTPTITSQLTIRDRATISDLNISGLSGTHSYVSDLSFNLTKQGGTSTDIMDFSNCGGQDNFDIKLDDEAANSNYPCPPNDGSTYQPLNALSSFDGNQAKGNWTLEIQDQFDDDGGALQSWGIEYCALDYCDLTVNIDTYSGFGSLSGAIDCAVDGDTIWLEGTIPNQSIDLGNQQLIIDKSIVIVADVATSITSSNIAASLVINAGRTVSMVGFTIESTSSIGLINNGDLVLVDMDIITDATHEQVVNNASSSLTVQGICNLRK